MDTHHTPHTPQHNNTTTTPHGDRDRDRRQRQRKKTGTEREEKRRRKRRRQDKRRKKIHFQCGGAWPVFVEVVLFLVNSVCARDLSLLNTVKNDCSVISFSAYLGRSTLFFLKKKICELFNLCSYSFLFYFIFLNFWLCSYSFFNFSKIIELCSCIFFAGINFA